MSKAANLSILASRDNFGQAGQALTSTGDTSTPGFSGLPSLVNSLSAINTGNSGFSTLSANSTTGNIIIRSDVSLSELDVPGWDKGQHITQWSTLQRYLSGVALTNRTIPVSGLFINYTSASFPGAAAIQGGVLAPNGKIYLMPFQGTSNVYTIDPNTDQVRSFAAASNYIGGVLAPNGFIYPIPTNEPATGTSSLGKINPRDDTFTNLGSMAAYGSNGFQGGALGGNGKIYAFPFSATVVLQIDPATDTHTGAAIIRAGGLFPGGYQGSVADQFGRVHGVPFVASFGAMIDPATNTITTYVLPAPYPNAGFDGGCLAPNGKIYCSPYYGTSVLVIDPTTNPPTASLFGNVNTGGGSEVYSGMCLAPNGFLYMGSSTSSLIRVIDPNNNTVSVIATISNISTANYAGICLAPNGKIYFPPYNSTRAAILINTFNNTFNLNVCTNPLINEGY